MSIYTNDTIYVNSLYASTSGIITLNSNLNANGKNLSNIGTFSASILEASSTSNQLILGTTKTTTISATAPATSITYTIPDAGSSTSFILGASNSGQTINGGLTLGTPLNIASGGTNSSTALVNGKLMYSSSGAIVEGTSATTPSFTSATLSGSIGQLVLGSTRTVTISAPQPGTSSVIYTIPDTSSVSTNANFILSTSASGQTIGGGLTLTTPLAIGSGGTNSSSSLTNGKIMISSGGSIIEGTSNTTPTFTSETLSSTTNQLVLGTTKTTTISATAPASSVTYTLPDAGANTSFILGTSGSGQTINGGLSLGTPLTIASGGTNSSTALNNNSPMISSGGKIVEAGTMTNGQLLIGSTGSTPVLATLHSSDSSVTITNGAGSINLQVNTSSVNTFNNIIITGSGSSPAGIQFNGTNVTIASNDLMTFTTSTTDGVVAFSQTATPAAGTGNLVQTIQSAPNASTSTNGPSELTYQSSIVTTNTATPATLQTFTMTSNTILAIHSIITAHCTSSTGGYTNLGGRWIVDAVFTNVGGNNVTVISAPPTRTVASSNSNWDSNLNASAGTNNILLQVTGSATETIVWLQTSTVYKVST